MNEVSVQSPKGQKRQQTIEHAARFMLLNDGYADFSMRKIALQLGITLGNLQYYFSTKDDLVEAVIRQEIQYPIDMLGEIAWSTDNVAASIRSAVESLLQYYASEAGRFYAIMESLAIHDSRYAKLKQEGYRFVLDHIEQLIGRISPALSNERRAALASILVALIDGASLQVQFARGDVHGDGVNPLIIDVSTAIEHLLKHWK